MLKKESDTLTPIASLLMNMLVSSVAVSLHLLNVDAEKVKEVVNTLTKCTLQEVPAVMGLLSSYYNARATEIGLMEWDKQQKSEEPCQLSNGLSTITKLLS